MIERSNAIDTSNPQRKPPLHTARPAYRTLQSWAPDTPVEQGAVSECEHHGHCRGGADPRLKTEAWNPFPGATPETFIAVLDGMTRSVGDTCRTAMALWQSLVIPAKQRRPPVLQGADKESCHEAQADLTAGQLRAGFTSPAFPTCTPPPARTSFARSSTTAILLIVVQDGQRVPASFPARRQM